MWHERKIYSTIKIISRQNFLLNFKHDDTGRARCVQALDGVPEWDVNLLAMIGVRKLVRLRTHSMCLSANNDNQFKIFLDLRRTPTDCKLIVRNCWKRKLLILAKQILFKVREVPVATILNGKGWFGLNIWN